MRDISFDYEYRGDSDMPLNNWRVTWIYIYCPFSQRYGIMSYIQLAKGPGAARGQKKFKKYFFFKLNFLAYNTLLLPLRVHKNCQSIWSSRSAGYRQHTYKCLVLCLKEEDNPPWDKHCHQKSKSKIVSPGYAYLVIVNFKIVLLGISSFVLINS